MRRLIKPICATMSALSALMVYMLFGGMDAEQINIIPGVILVFVFVAIAGVFARLAKATWGSR